MQLGFMLLISWHTLMFDEFEQPAQHKPRKEQNAAVPSKQLIGLHVMLRLG